MTKTGLHIPCAVYTEKTLMYLKQLCSRVSTTPDIYSAY